MVRVARVGLSLDVLQLVDVAGELATLEAPVMRLYKLNFWMISLWIADRNPVLGMVSIACARRSMDVTCEVTSLDVPPVTMAA
ncbi:unnamed protein product [Fasciola hepatica]|uniref:Uncharacterized protein n=1 Tax=Fasciola hepatica TaxID=6192 RepID=A0ABC9HJC5_FASHE